MPLAKVVFAMSLVAGSAESDRLRGREAIRSGFTIDQRAESSGKRCAADRSLCDRLDGGSPAQIEQVHAILVAAGFNTINTLRNEAFSDATGPSVMTSGVKA